MEESATRRGLEKACADAEAPILGATLRDIRAARFTPPHPSGPLRVVGSYALLEEIGQGGMGLVFKARQLKLDRLVAVKMLRSGCASPEDLVRFRTEAEAVAQLIHPGIVQIHEIGEHEGVPFLSLEYVPGGSLDRHLARKPLAPRAAASLVHAVAEAVEFAHSRGVIHRDLKPANVLLSQEQEPATLRRKAGREESPSGEPEKRRGGEITCWTSTLATQTRRSAAPRLVPKITDFGLAKRLDGTPGHTRDGEVIGTPAYMAPEQAEGRKDIGKAVDVYALGAILYECLTGRPPFLGKTLADILAQVRERDPVPPRRLAAGIPRDLETICLKCLEKDPRRRYASAAAFAEDVDRFLVGEPIRARAVGPFERARKWARRRPSAAALALVSGLFVTVLLAAGPIYIASLHRLVKKMSGEQVNLLENNRRADLLVECAQLLENGRKELKKGDLDSVQRAAVLFATAERSISDGDATSDSDATLSKHLALLRGEAAREKKQAGEEMQKLLGVGPVRDMVRRQEHFRDDAFFQLHRDLLGGPTAGLPQASLEAARKGLELEPKLKFLDKQEASQALAVRLDLLLLFAEATVRVDGSSDRVREALALLDRAEQIGGPSRAVSLRRARYLEKLGDDAGAAEQRRRAAALSQGGSSVDWFLIAQERWLADDLTHAVVDLDRVLNMQPRHFWARLLRAVAWQRLDQPTDARAELTLCIQARPEFGWAYLLRAPLWLPVRGGLDQARRDLDRAEKLLAEDQSARYVLKVNRGVLALAENDPRAAVQALQHAALIMPKRYHAHASRAQAYWLSGKRDLALASMNYALSLDPTQPELYRTRGRMRTRLGDHRGALADAERVLKMDTRASARQRSADRAEKSRLLYRLGRYNQALALCERVLDDQPCDPLALRLHAETLLELNRPREALAAFDRYLKHGAPDVEFYRRRARARAAAGDLTGVADDFTLALAIRRDAPLLTARGWANLVAGAAKPALRDFDAALELNARDAEARVGRSSALLELGKREAALDQVREVLNGGEVSSRVLYHAARVLARSAPPGPLREVRRQQERALHVLGRAARSVPAAERARFWKDQVCRDEVFRPLRSLTAFGKLQDEILAE